MAKISTLVNLSFGTFLLTRLEKLGGYFELDGIGRELNFVTYSEGKQNWYHRLFGRSPKPTKSEVRIAWIVEIGNAGSLQIEITVYSKRWVSVIHPILEDYEEWMSGDSRKIEAEVILKHNFKKSQLQSEVPVSGDSSGVDSILAHLAEGSVTTENSQ